MSFDRMCFRIWMTAYIWNVIRSLSLKRNEENAGTCSDCATFIYCRSSINKILPDPTAESEHKNRSHFCRQVTEVWTDTAFTLSLGTMKNSIITCSWYKTECKITVWIFVNQMKSDGLVDVITVLSALYLHGFIMRIHILTCRASLQ